jgi:hypothetical protein
VASGTAKNRADFLRHAIKREQRRLAAERDAAIYAREGEDPDLVAFLKHTAQLGYPELD